VFLLERCENNEEQKNYKKIKVILRENLKELQIRMIIGNLNTVNLRQGCERLGSFSCLPLWQEKSRSEAEPAAARPPACQFLTAQRQAGRPNKRT